VPYTGARSTANVLPLAVMGAEALEARKPTNMRHSESEAMDTGPYAAHRTCSSSHGRAGARRWPSCMEHCGEVCANAPEGHSLVNARSVLTQPSHRSHLPGAPPRASAEHSRACLLASALKGPVPHTHANQHSRHELERDTWKPRVFACVRALVAVVGVWIWG
jgi:hypothetical protein